MKYMIEPDELQRAIILQQLKQYDELKGRLWDRMIDQIALNAHVSKTEAADWVRDVQH